MNTDIYNERVASFQVSVRDLENDILNGSLKMETSYHLDQLFSKIDRLWNEFESIYKNIENPISQNQLLVNLRDEIEFLILLSNLINSLLHYRHVTGDFISTPILKNAWNDVCTIINFKNKMANYEKGMDYLTQKMLDIRVKNAKLYSQEFHWFENILSATEKEFDEAKNRIEEIGKAEQRIDPSNGTYQDNMRVISHKASNFLDELSAKTMQSIDNFYRMIDVEYGIKSEFQEAIDKSLDKEISDVQLDANYMNTLSLPQQIKYVKLVIANIEAIGGQKTTVKYKGITKRISSEKKCVSNWIKCQAKLRTLTNQYESELSSTLEDQKAKEEYASLYEQFVTVEERLFSLRENAKEFMNTNQVVAVASLNKEPFYVLKKSLNRFNEYFVVYKRLQKEMKNLAEKYDLGEIPTLSEIEDVEVREAELYGQIHFLKNQKEKMELGQNTDEINAEIKELQSELYKLNRGKKFALFANLKVKFKSIQLSEDISTYYARLAENPENFVQSKEYSDKEKKYVLNAITTRLKKIVEAEGKKEENKKKNNILVEQFCKVKRGLNLLPKNIKNTFKIKKSRNAVDVNEMGLRIARVSALVACFGTIAVLASSNKEVFAREKTNTFGIENDIEEDTFVAVNEQKHSENSISNDLHEIIKEEEDTTKLNVIGTVLTGHDEAIKKLEEEKTNFENLKTDKMQNIKASVTEKIPSYESALENAEMDYIDFDDYFTSTDGNVYQTALEASNEENPQSTYYGKDSVREVAGIVYKYNDTIIPVYKDQVDAEATRIALINNGAEQVGVLGMNENASTKGWEGYFNDEKIQLVLDDEVSIIEGRGGR